MVLLELLHGGATRCSTGYTTENKAVVQTEFISSNMLLFRPSTSVAFESTEPHRLSTLQLSYHLSIAPND